MIKFIKKRFKLIIISLLVVAVGFGGYYLIWGKKATAAAKIQEYIVRTKNMDVTISGSGAVVSTSRQDVSSEVPGTILKVYHSEGDKVKAGDVLFQLDDSTAASTVERTRNSIEQAQTSLNTARNNISYLNVTTPIVGQVSNILVNAGDNVNKGQEICTVTDTSNLKLTVPFNGNQIKNIYVGEPANVFLQDYLDTVSGTVTYVSNGGQAVAGGGTLYNVDISISNPGSIISGAKASAQIGNQYSVDSGSIQYASSQKVRAQVSGSVQSINVNNQQLIGVGQNVVTLSNDDLYNQLNNAQSSLQDLQVQLSSQIKTQDNYKVTAVIDGTITSQTAKAGDFVNNNNANSNALAVITNPDEMQFNIPVDELDIAKIQVGMPANVNLDALPGKNFDGVVSSVSGTGTSSNGVTTYPVTVVIKNPVGIKEGMNANADIQVQHKDNVLTLPIQAVQKMGSRYFVFVKSANGASSNSGSNQGTNQWSGRSSGQNSSNGSGNQQGGSGQSRNGSQGSSQNRNSRQQSMLKLLGPGVSMKMVQVGINNDSDIEIVSGLNEGDIVEVPVIASTTSSTQQQGGLFGGMGGGGMRSFGGGQGGSGSQYRNSSGSQNSGGQGNSNISSQGNSGGGNRGD